MDHVALQVEGVAGGVPIPPMWRVKLFARANFITIMGLWEGEMHGTSTAILGYDLEVTLPHQQSEVLIMCVSGGSGGWSCVIEHPHLCYSGDNGNLGFY